MIHIKNCGKKAIGYFCYGILLFLLELRWAYFHIHPRYIKFGIGEEQHFQNIETGEVHSDYVFEDMEEDDGV